MHEMVDVVLGMCKIRLL